MPEETPNETPEKKLGLLDRIRNREAYVPAEVGEIKPERVQERQVYLQALGDLYGAVVLGTRDFAHRITQRQRLYAAKLMEVGPDRWQEAATVAGYAPGTARSKIEESPALIDYCAALCHEQATHEAITTAGALSNLARLSRKAEEEGDYGAAIRAEKIILQATGGLTGEKDGPSGGINANGNVIIIQNSTTRNETDEAVYATDKYAEIMRANEKGWQRVDGETATILPPQHEALPTRGPT